MIKTIIRKESEYEMTYWKKNDFERVEGVALLIVGNLSDVNRESKMFIINKKGNVECGMEYEKGSV